MAPGTHALIGWWTANVLPLSRRDRLLVFAGGVLPDLDGLGLLFSDELYLKYHHVLCHNLFCCLAWAALVALLARDRTRCVSLAILNWHIHLAADYFGSRGPWDNPPWVLPYLYPLLGTVGELDLVGPSWYWNQWQWPLNAWPNVLITLVGFAGWVYIAVRLNRTWFEFVWPRGDEELCRTLRKWLGGQATEHWTGLEARVIFRSYLIATVLIICACIVAATH